MKKVILRHVLSNINNDNFYSNGHIMVNHITATSATNVT